MDNCIGSLRMAKKLMVILFLDNLDEGEGFLRFDFVEKNFSFEI